MQSQYILKGKHSKKKKKKEYKKVLSQTVKLEHELLFQVKYYESLNFKEYS